MLHEPNWHLQTAKDGLLLFAKGQGGFFQDIEQLTIKSQRSNLVQFEDAIGLRSAIVESVGGVRFRLQLDWVALRPLTDMAPLIAVSRPEGIANARIAHLPTLALLPTTEWSTDQIVRETFEFALPEETPPGEYPLYLGWYDSSNLYAAETDGRSRVGEEIQIGVLIVR
jgi:hypothetical protein